MKRVALFSDIHGNFEALSVILKDIKEEKFDEVICLGDVVSIGPSSNKCMDEIRKNNIKMLLGNHEYYLLLDEEALKKRLNKEGFEHEMYIRESLSKENIDYIKKSNLEYIFLANGKLFSFSHFFLEKEGYPFSPIYYINSEHLKNILNTYETDYLFIGHEHFNFEVSNSNKKIICLGSSGCTKGNETHYTILEIDNDFVKVNRKLLKYKRKDFIKEVQNTYYPLRNHMAKNFLFIDKELENIKKEKSCGAVVYKKDINEKIYYLIIKHNDGHFSFPKGHMEENETEKNTALREIKEETNVDVVLDDKFKKVSIYSPKENVIKTVVFFLGVYKNGKEIPQKEEISLIKWLSYEEAINIITYDADKNILKEANDYTINNHKE